jgi:hypothetical protein
MRHYGAERWLVTESGVSYRQLVAVTGGSRPFTGLSIADDLLAAIGLSFLLGGTIPVISNPQWSVERVLRELRRRGCDLEERFWLWPEELVLFRPDLELSATLGSDR